MSQSGTDMTPEPGGGASPRGRRMAGASRAKDKIARDAPTPSVVIAVGNVRVPGADVIAVAGPEGLDAVLLATLGAECVVCPLFDAAFDAMAVAARLAALGFQGRLQVIAPELPNPRMVEREIRSQAAGLTVQILQRP